MAEAQRLHEQRRQEVEATDAEIEALKQQVGALDTKLLAAEEKAQSLEAQLAQKQLEVAAAVARADAAESKLAEGACAEQRRLLPDSEAESNHGPLPEGVPPEQRGWCLCLSSKPSPL